MPPYPPPNVKKSDHLATLDKQLKAYREDNLYWFDDIALDGTQETKIDSLKQAYAIVLTGPAYTTDGDVREGYESVWISWPPGPR